MLISQIVPQSIVVFIYGFMIVKAAKKYTNKQSIANEKALNNLILGVAFMLLLLVWGGFFTPINQW